MCNFQVKHRALLSLSKQLASLGGLQLPCLFFILEIVVHVIKLSSSSPDVPTLHDIVTFLKMGHI